MTHEASDRPAVRLTPKTSAKAIRFGAPWAWSDQIVLDRRTRAVPAGTIVELQDADRQPLGAAAFNPGSRIAVRMLDRDPTVSIDVDWFRARVVRALSLRETLFDAPFYRLIHAEADGMPGVIVDRFGDAAVIQPNAAWIETRLGDFAAALASATGVTAIIKNGSGRARALEGLGEETTLLTGALDGPVPVPMNGATYMADLIGGQKTGLFFDQHPNHAFAARLSRGRDVLDVFCHVGGFGLAALANGAISALGVDGSQPALDLAEQGARATGVADRYETRKSDAFDALAELATQDRRFGVVVCDPPAFAPNRKVLDAGLRAYERVARLGAALVEAGGFLVLCSCSHAVAFPSFREACLRGVGRAGRTAQIVGTGGAGPDHPVHPYLAETSYLKSVFLRLDA